MKLEKQINSADIQSTGTVTAMKLDEDAHSTIFEIFTSGLYSDPIGSIIREITSNCFDSHVEAGTDNPKNPVVVKLTNEVSGTFISFIDKGVGMSPDRVHNIYGTYFKSTKNQTNNQIGGFGLGGKTPLAYTESFFLITRHNGIEYTYNIFMGNESPMVELLSQESTKKVNGSEVKILIKPNDVTAFEKKTLRQLYYFENIVFEGFSDYYVSNEYTIAKGDTFLYRGDTYSRSMHVCLGKVAYPINFEALDVEESDYKLPVAIKIEIGELDNGGVTRSREELKYTDANKKIILKKMNAVKAELMELLSKQYDNVQTMAEYYNVIDNIGTLYLGKKELIIDNIGRNDVAFPNFKYNDLKMPKYDELLSTFYNTKTFGKKESTRYWSSKYKNSFEDMQQRDNVFYCDGEFKRVVLKQSYLQWKSDRFFLHTPKDFTETGMAILKKDLGLTITKDIPFSKKEIAAKEKAKKKAEDNVEFYLMGDLFRTKTINVIPKAKGEKLIADLFKEVKALMVKGAKSYDNLVVPDDYIALRKQNRMSASVLKTGIPVKDKGHYGFRNKMTMEQFVNLRGKIYYGFADDSYELEIAANVFKEISDNKHIARINRYDDKESKGTMFIQISKGNEKYLKMLGKKAIHVNYFYQTYVARKLDMILQNKANQKAEQLFDDNVLEVFSKSIFKSIDKEIYDAAFKVRDSLLSHKEFYHISNDTIFSKLGIDLENVQVEFEHKEELEYLTKISDASRNRLQWFNFPYEINPKNDAHKELIEMVKLCIDK